MGYKILLNLLSERFQGILGENLTGIYIHGSIAFGCFNRDKSDIDFIAVVENPLLQKTKLELLGVLEELSGSAPEKGFEMSAVLREYCRNFLYPTPYELHFSNAWRLEKYLKNPSFLSGAETDRDLAAHFTIIKSAGLILFGEPIENVFGNIPREHYLDSICLDIKNAEEDVLNNPISVILNLCRVYAYIKDGTALSKEQGGKWGIVSLPDRYRGLIAETLDDYKRGAGVSFGLGLRIDFCKYMLAEIFGAEN